MQLLACLSIVCITALLLSVTSYTMPYKTVLTTCQCCHSNIALKMSQEGTGDKDLNSAASDSLEKSLLNAKRNIETKSSPGANLQTADEQADAAFADIIYSSMQQRGITELSKGDKELLAKGATMWEKGAKDEKKTSLIGNIMSVFEALSGGAHITKNEFGET